MEGKVARAWGRRAASRPGPSDKRQLPGFAAIPREHGHNFRTCASHPHSCRRARARSPSLHGQRANCHNLPSTALSTRCEAPLCTPDNPRVVRVQLTLPQVRAAAGRAMEVYGLFKASLPFNAAAAVRMPPPRADARSSSCLELGRSSASFGGLVYVLLGLLPRRVPLDFSVILSSSTTSREFAEHAHEHCAHCACLRAL